MIVPEIVPEEDPRVGVAPRPFDELRELPAGLRIPPWLAALVVAAACAGVAQSFLTEEGAVVRVFHSSFLGAAYAYLAVSLVDFVEHFRIEKRVTGRYTTFRAIPLGESLNHAATITVILAMMVIARPFPEAPGVRDWLWPAAPALYLVLGWRDELVYHRRRSRHREDIMHTVAHIAAGVMMGGFIALQLVASRPSLP